MRRTLAGSLAFAAMTATFVVLPVSAAPAPEAEPVETSAGEVEMGSVAEPADAAEVQQGTTDPVEGVADTSPVLTVRETDTDPFSLVGVTWAPDDAVTDTVVQIRVRDEDGAWGDWTLVTVEDAEQDAGADSGAAPRGGTAPLWTGPSTGVEAELVTRSGAQPTDVQLTLVDPGASDADAALGSPEITDTAEAAGSMPPVYSRAQWGADESIRTWGPQYAPTIKAATIHHTADSNGYTADDVPAIMRSIYRYHTVSRGWGDMGYNVIADKYGRLWEGRYGGLASTVVGAHAGGFNTGTFGVSMLGNYETVAPSSAMLASVADIVAWKLALYRVDPKGTAALTSGGGGTARWPAGTVVYMPTIFAHRDVGTTACPGKYAYARMNDLREMVGTRMAGYGTPTLGNVEDLSVRGQTVSLRGWSIDPNAQTTASTVTVTVDGEQQTELRADQSRPDVGAAYPAAGSRHGFSGSTTVPEGEHDVCVTLQPVANRTLPNTACRTLTAVDPERLKEPVGNVDAVVVDGRRIDVRGWTLDQDALATALDVHVYVNDAWGGSYRADRTRADVGRAFPGAGNAHGYDLELAVAGPGTYEVCVYGINTNGGSRNPALGCRTVTSPEKNWAPEGSLDAVTVSGRTVTARGWTLDRDVPATSLDVHVYVDGRWSGQATATGTRTDVGRAFPGAGNAHGYEVGLDVAPGRHQVCVFAINAGYGVLNPQLGCATVTVDAAAWNPFGSLDQVTVSGGVATFKGWTIDPDIWRGTARVHVYADGGFVGEVSAGQSRTDVGRAYPQAGAAHGYSGSFGLARGTHQVCTYAINTGQGTTNPALGCRTVTVP